DFRIAGTGEESDDRAQSLGADCFSRASMRAARSSAGSNSKSSSGVYLRPSDLPSSRRMKPLALLKPATAAGARTEPSRCEKYTRPWRRSSSILTAVRVMPRRRGSRRSRTSSPDSSRKTASATRSGLRPSGNVFPRHDKRRATCAAFFSAVDDFELLLAERDQAQRIDEVHELAQRAVHERAIAADLRDAQLGALPQVVAVGLGDGDVELVADASLDRAQHLSFALERMILRQKQGQPHDADDHDDTPPPPTRRPARPPRPTNPQSRAEAAFRRRPDRARSRAWARRACAESLPSRKLR